MKNPILIVGGGVGGMTCALALAKKNIPSIVLEQAAKLREAGAGIQFCPNTFKVLDYLNIASAFKEIAIFPENLRYVDGLTSKEILKLPLGNDIVAKFKHPFGSFHREEMLHAFVDECKKSSLISFVTSAKVVKVEETTDGVIAHTDGGQSYKGDALVGCDGLWSMVRRFIVGDEAPRNSGQIIYRGVVEKEKMPSGLELDDIVHYVRPHAHLVFYPIGKKGLFNISAIFQSDRFPDDREIEGKPEELYRWFSGSHPKVMEILDRVDTSIMRPLCDRNPRSCWTKGRMTLLGDAAHATLPYLTSGAGMAVEDAVVLADCLGKYKNDYTAAFKAYEEKRYLRCAYVQYFSRAYGDVHHSTGVARELRNHLLAKRSVEENYQWISYLYNGIEFELEK